MNVVSTITNRVTRLSPLLFIYSLLYYKGLSFTKNPSYINSFVHTIVLLSWLSLSYDNIKYVIPWSQSYYIVDSMVSAYVLTKPLLLNGYNTITNKLRKSDRHIVPTGHIGFLLHHFVVLYLLHTIQIRSHILMPFTTVYYPIECSNLFLQISYFMFQKYGTLHPISKTMLGIEIMGYGYIRLVTLLKLLLQYWSILPFSLRLCAVFIYSLGVFWTSKLCLQFKKNICKKNIKDIKKE